MLRELWHSILRRLRIVSTKRLVEHQLHVGSLCSDLEGLEREVKELRAAYEALKSQYVAVAAHVGSHTDRLHEISKALPKPRKKKVTK